MSKGDISSTVIILAVVIIAVAVVAIFVVWQGKLTGGAARGECSARITEACDKFLGGAPRTTSFTHVPQHCTLYFAGLGSCIGQNANDANCRDYCINSVGRGTP